MRDVVLSWVMAVFYRRWFGLLLLSIYLLLPLTDAFAAKKPPRALPNGVTTAFSNEGTVYCSGGIAGEIKSRRFKSLSAIYKSKLSKLQKSITKQNKQIAQQQAKLARLNAKKLAAAEKKIAKYAKKLATDSAALTALENEITSKNSICNPPARITPPADSPSPPDAPSPAPTATATPAPSALTAPANLRAVSTSASAIQIAWDDQSTNEEHFLVERQVGNGPFSEIAVLPPNSTSYAQSNLSPVSSYSYRVRASLGSVFSNYSNTASLTTLAAPIAAPTPFTVLSNSTTSGSLAVAISPSGNITSVPEEHIMLEALPTGGTAPYAFQWLLNGSNATNSQAAVGYLQGVNDQLLNVAHTVGGQTATIAVRVIDGNGVTATSSSVTISVNAASVAAPGPVMSYQLSARVQSSPPGIVLEWPAATEGAPYYLTRRSLGGAFGSVIQVNTNSYIDTNIVAGQVYEYQLSRSWRVGSIQACYGCSAARLETAKTILLLAESNLHAALGNDLQILIQALNADGWRVDVLTVAKTASVASVKALIKNWYSSTANAEALFLLGHVPVPYSGCTNPDGHPDHRGAWPSDAYYADVVGAEWSDTSVCANADARLNNVAGDGKFDAYYAPSAIELQLGRVDFNGMTLFSTSGETDFATEVRLTKHYIHKNYLYRNHLAPYDTVRNAALIVDRFGAYANENFAQNGYQDYATLFGYQKIYESGASRDLQNVASRYSFLAYYGDGAGSYQTMNGGGSTTALATTKLNLVFAKTLGSYFGDWDNANNYNRGILANLGLPLTVYWSGRPKLSTRGIELGGTLGDGFRYWQNTNSNQPHESILGDPTLRLLLPAPPRSPQLEVLSSTQVRISWIASTESGLSGYYVYRASSANGPWSRMTASPVTGTTYTDSLDSSSGKVFYLIRAVKPATNAGSYVQISQGAMLEANRS